MKKYMSITNFINDLQELIKNENPFKYFHLFNVINKVISKSIICYDAWIFKTENEGWIIGFWVDGHYFIYGKNWCENDINDIIEKIDFSIFKPGFHFLGGRNLIEKICELGETNLEDFKNRYFYQISSKKNAYISHKQKIRVPSKDDIIELTRMHCDYFEEEYEGKNNKDFDLMKEKVISIIKDNSIFISKNENEISGYCTTLYSKSDAPLIGNLFVKKKFRNNGIGKILLNFTTNKLLTNAEICYMVTEMENKAMNKVAESIGFVKIYDYSDKIITDANNR